MTHTKALFSKLPLKVWILGGALFVIVLSYSLIFFIPKSVEFSYADKSCVGQLVLAPGMQKFSSSEFDGRLDGIVKIGNVEIASTKVCFEPKEAPEKGEYTARLAPFGGWIASKQFAIQTPDSPAAPASEVVGRAISATQPLKIKLTNADIIHKYSLKIAERETTCQQDSAELSCEIAPLELKHGTEYTASLYQSYKQSEKKLVEGTLETLLPLVMSSSSITKDQVVYDAPETATFTFDKTVESVEISLSKTNGDKTDSVATTQDIKGKEVAVSFGKLDREASYTLTIKEAIADNGSSLAEPIVVQFTTSGGPKVASVSVGAHSVPRSAKIIVTLDQPIDDSVDIAKFAKVTGVTGSVSKQSKTQLAFSIRGGDCTSFGLTIDKGIKSGSNGEISKESWKFNSRTICGSSWVIGSSVKGRAIVAYSFGSGPSTILFTGGIHGSERSAQQTMQAWVEHLQAYGDIVPAGKRVVIVPNTNPDGIAAGTRNNSRNVNLGRNFPTRNWSASIETASGTLPTGGGTSAGSEPEAAALISLTRQLKPRLSISFHSQGRLVGANKFGDSVALGNTYAKTVGYQTMFYNAEAVMGYPMTGEYEDWMGEEMGIPAILIELPSNYGNYLSSQLAALKKMLAL